MWSARLRHSPGDALGLRYSDLGSILGKKSCTVSRGDAAIAVRRWLQIGVLGVVAVLSGAAMAAQPADALPPASNSLDEAAAARFAHLALACLHKEYPNKISHVMLSDADALPPRVLTPAFYGCYDWHSGVHGHWLLVRLLRLFPNAPFAKDARAALSANLTPKNIAGEVAYVKNEARASFERPYGLAWLLQLSAELRSWDDSQGHQWAAALAPLEMLAASKLKSWLPKLHYPIRVGEHDQTAFSFGLMWDWARIAGDAQMKALLVDAAERFYRGDRNCPLSYEPSGQDFLSPCLAEADFMRRVLEPEAFAKWLGEFLPQIPSTGGGRVVAARGGDGPSRPEVGAYRRTQFESGVDARGDCARFEA